jgi:CheY-like chemotaxis protein
MSKLTTVLLVDDSTLSRRIISGMFPSGKLTIIEAKSGREAIAKILTYDIDIILLDLLMSDMNGFDVLKYSQTKELKIPIIVISADIQETTKLKCIELGAETLINKPPNPEVLIAEVEKALEKRRNS